MKVLICRKNGADTTCFTDGKQYPVLAEYDGLYQIECDHGDPKVVLPGVPSPLLRAPYGTDSRELLPPEVGVFELLEVP